MAKAKAQVEIEVQNAGAIAAVQALIGNIQGVNRELITAKFGFQTAFQTANQIIQATTGQAQQLEKQILSLTGTFASLSQVVSAGINLQDPLAKINALQPAIEKSIDKVREISLTVSGVQSSQLVEIFQTIATNSSRANLSLDQSVQLVKSFSAGLVAANIPLFQQRQEISSILTSQITQDSTLAKTLGITNEIVEREKARNNLVNFLNERLKTSVVIQEKISATIEGVSSNIIELAELTQSAFGQQLLKPITNTLTAFYNFLDANKDRIFGGAQFLANQLVEVGVVLKGVFDSTFPLIATVGEFLGTFAANQIQNFVVVLQGLGAAASAVASVIGAVLIPIFKVLNTDLGQIVVTAGLFATVVNVGAVGATIKFAEALFQAGAAAVAVVARIGLSIAAYVAESVATFNAVKAKEGLIAANNALAVSYGQVLAAQSGVVATSAAVQGLAILTTGLITIGVAAAAATVALVVLTNQLEKQNEAAERGRIDAAIAFDSSLKTAEGLKRLAEQRAKNGKLSKEEEEQEKKLQETSKRNIEANNKEIEALKARTAKFPELREQNEVSIKQLEKINEALSGITTKGLEVKDVGAAYAFLAEQAKSALKAVQSGVNLEEFERKAKLLADTTKQQVEQGFITRQQGIEQLDELSKNEKLKVEVRFAANKQILDLIKDFGKEEIELNKAKQAALEQLANNGFITQSEFLTKSSELTFKTLDIEADRLRKQTQQIEEATRRERFSALSKIEQEIEDAKKGKATGTGDIIQDTKAIKFLEDKLKERQKLIEDFDNKELINAQQATANEAKIRSDRLKAEQDDIQKQVKNLRGILERELEENGNLRKKAEFAAQADIAALRLGGFQNELVLEEQSLAQKQRNLESELADKRRALEFDKTLLANFVGSQAEKEALILKISKQEADIAKLNLDATDNLIARTKILYDAKIKGIEQEKDSLDKVSKLLQSQNDLQAARINLIKVVNDAELKSGETRLNSLKEVQSLLKEGSTNQQELSKRAADAEVKANRDAILAKLSDEEKATKQKQFAQEDQAKAEFETKAKQANADRINNEKALLTRQRLAELGFSTGNTELDIARRVFEQEQKNLELKARQFEQNQQNEQRSLLIQQQQAEIRDKQLATEAKLALLRAQESGKTDLIKSALELVNLTETQITNNRELAKVQTDTLNVQQKSAREVFNIEQGNAAFKNKVAGVESGLTANQVLGGAGANIQANQVFANPIGNINDAQKTIKQNQEENVRKVLDARSQTLGNVAQGAVAFEDTAQKVADNFDRLPKSLKATSDGLKEVIGFAKELSSNPLFASREEAARKQAEANKQLQTEASQRAAQLGFNRASTNNAVNDLNDTEAKNRAIKESNAKVAERNRLGAATNNLLNNADGTGFFGSIGIANDSQTITQAEANRLNKIEDEKRRKKRELEAADKLLQELNKQPVNRLFNLNRFTGGIAPAEIPITVNEQGQEAVTNLRTGETMLLPSGERQVIFGDTSYVHNASETRQMMALNNTPIAMQSDSVVMALGRLYDLIANREAKLDSRVYDVTRAMIRATAF